MRKKVSYIVFKRIKVEFFYSFLIQDEDKTRKDNDNPVLIKKDIKSKIKNGKLKKVGKTQLTINITTCRPADVVGKTNLKILRDFVVFIFILILYELPAQVPGVAPGIDF